MSCAPSRPAPGRPEASPRRPPRAEGLGPLLRPPAARSALCLLLGLGLLAAAEALPLVLKSQPPLPLEAELGASAEDEGALELRIRLPGRRGEALVDIGLEPGLSLVADSSRPYVDAGGGTGSELLLEFRSSGGAKRVLSLLIGNEEGNIRIAPFDLALASGAGGGEGGARPWAWSGPSRVYRYQSFALGLEAPGGGGPEPGAWPSFELPPGLYLEARTGAFSWTATALEAGSLLLPKVEIQGGLRAEAPPRSLEVLELPPALASSRAIGDFSLALQGPAGAEAGSSLILRLEVRGEGNLPSLLLPRLRLRLQEASGAARELKPEEERRIDAIEAGPAGYRGSSTLELSLRPPRAGLLLAELEPWPLMDSSGRVRYLSLPPYRLTVEAGRAPGPGPGTAEAEALLSSLAPRLPAAEAALASFRAGREGEGLATLYHAARFQASYRAGALALASGLGLPEPELGAALGPLLPLLLGGLGLLALVPALLFRPRLGRRALPVLLLASLLALGGSSLASLILADRARPRALAWSTELLSRPAEDSERRLRVGLGRTGSLIGESEGWLCLRFSDGSAGWLPASSVYSY